MWIIAALTREHGDWEQACLRTGAARSRRAVFLRVRLQALCWPSCSEGTSSTQEPSEDYLQLLFLQSPFRGIDNIGLSCEHYTIVTFLVRGSRYYPAFPPEACQNL